MKHLKKIAHKKAQEIRLKDFLHAAIGGFEKARSLHIIHASDLTKEDREYCPREVALHLHLKKKRKDQYISAPMAITFQEGRDKQARLNNDWLKDRVVGDWECQSCGAVRNFCKKPNYLCDRQGVRCSWQYEEPRFVHDVARASGGMDAFVDLGLPKLRLVECKIIDKDYFKKLKAPLSEHKTRTQLYLKLIAESDHPKKDSVDTTRAHILYIMRGYGSKDEEGDITPFREFVVERNDKLVEEYLTKAHALTLWQNLPELGFPYGVCENTMCPRAKSCAVKAECFSGDYAPTISWTDGGESVHNAEVVADGTSPLEAYEGLIQKEASA